MSEVGQTHSNFITTPWASRPTLVDISLNSFFHVPVSIRPRPVSPNSTPSLICRASSVKVQAILALNLEFKPSSVAPYVQYSFQSANPVRDTAVRGGVGW